MKKNTNVIFTLLLTLLISIAAGCSMTPGVDMEDAQSAETSQQTENSKAPEEIGLTGNGDAQLSSTSGNWIKISPTIVGKNVRVHTSTGSYNKKIYFITAPADACEMRIIDSKGKEYVIKKGLTHTFKEKVNANYGGAYHSSEKVVGEFKWTKHPEIETSWTNSVLSKSKFYYKKTPAPSSQTMELRLSSSKLNIFTEDVLTIKVINKVTENYMKQVAHYSSYTTYEPATRIVEQDITGKCSIYINNSRIYSTTYTPSKIGGYSVKIKYGSITKTASFTAVEEGNFLKDIMQQLTLDDFKVDAEVKNGWDIQSVSLGFNYEKMRKIVQSIPKTHIKKSDYTEMAVSDFDVSFSNGRLYFSSKARVKKFTKVLGKRIYVGSVTGKTKVSCRIWGDTKTGEIVLDQMRLDKIDIHNFNSYFEKYLKKVIEKELKLKSKNVTVSLAGKGFNPRYAAFEKIELKSGFLMVKFKVNTLNIIDALLNKIFDKNVSEELLSYFNPAQYASQASSKSQAAQILGSLLNALKAQGITVKKSDIEKALAMLGGGTGSSSWKTDTTSLRSARVTRPNSKMTVYTFTKSGAKQLKIHFSYFNSTKNRDFVYIYDGKGKYYGRYHGRLSAFNTAAVPGDTIVIKVYRNYRTPSIVVDYLSYKN